MLNVGRRAPHPVLVVVGGLLAVLPTLAGCVQRIDLVKQEKDLTAKIAKARADLDQLIGETGARFNQELAALREEELPALRGSLDKELNRFEAVQRRLDDLENKTAARLGVLENIQHDQANLLKAERDRAQADRDRLQEELAKLAETVGALAKAVDERLGASDKRITDQAAQVTQLSRSVTELSAKVEADSKLTAKHLAEVNKSIGSVTTALQKVGEAFETREAEQDRRLEEMAKTVRDMAALAGKGKEEKSRKNSKPAPRSGHTAEMEPPAKGRTSAGVGAVEGRSANGAEKSYERSLQAFRNGDLEEARKGFADFLERYPDSELAGNAQYWLGECYYGAKEYGQAIEAFDRVEHAYPNNPKVPAALLKKGFAYVALNDRGRASSVLKQVVEAYPQSPEAVKAKEKLAHLQ